MSKYWDEKREQVNALILELQQKPDREKIGYPLVAGGILNAYREGDVTYDVAVSQLEEWAIKYAAQQSVQADSLPRCACGQPAIYNGVLCEACADAPAANANC